MNRLVLIITATLCASLIFATCTNADVPRLIRFQGKATDNQGAPLNGAYNITFRIYNSETGGTLLWSETQASTPVNKGIFTVLLGNVSALDLPFDEPYWLSMEIDEDGEMLPRQAITSSAYAIYADKAKTIDGASVVPSGAIILWRGKSCPVGYHAVNDLQGKFVMGKAEGEAEATGGSQTHDHGVGSYTVGNHTLTVAEMPAHTHTGAVNIGVAGDEGDARAGCRVSAANTGSTGGGQAHNHPFSGRSAPADTRPPFVTVLFCEKD